MPSRFGRRKFVLAAAVMLMSMLPAFGRRSVIHGKLFRHRAATNLARVFANSYSVHRVGAAYLDMFPEDRDPGVLMDHMRRQDEALVVALENGSTGRLRQRVAGNVRNDFTHGRTVKIDGWLLSLSEVRLCALAAVLWDETSNAL